MLNATDLFVVLLKSSQVLTSLRELTLLHSLSDIPGTKILLVNSFNFSFPLSYHASPPEHQPSYQWTKARLAYMRSNLWSSLAQASAIAVVLLSMQTHLAKKFIWKRTTYYVVTLGL